MTTPVEDYPWYKALAIWTSVLVAIDAILTWYEVDRGLAAEGNVAVGALIDWIGLEWGLLLRTVLAIAGLAYISEVCYDTSGTGEASGTGDISGQKLRRRARLARVGLWVAFGAYLLVNVYHVLGAIVWR